MSAGSHRPTLGGAGRWARDLAIAGGGTSLLAVAFIEQSASSLTQPFVIAATVLGALVGAVMGLGLRRLLIAWLYLPLLVWVPISLVLGAIWGGTVGGLAMFIDEAVRPGSPQLSAVMITGALGAVAGALQLGWLWLPYAVRAGRGKSTWPVVLVALVVGTFSGYLALRLVLPWLNIRLD